MTLNLGENSLALFFGGPDDALETPHAIPLPSVQALATNGLTEGKSIRLPRFVALRNTEKKYLSLTLEGKYKMHVRREKTAQDADCTFSVDLIFKCRSRPKLVLTCRREVWELDIVL